MSDPERSVTPTGEIKRPRSFLCRDGLWTALEAMAGDLECSVDYLINDAIKNYARTRVRMSVRGATNPPRVPPPPPPFAPPPPPWNIARPPPPPPMQTRPLPPLPVPPPRPPPSASPPRLTVTYGDQVVVVNRTGFVIGRSKHGGLSIRDPNVSRQHAIIEIHDGRYFLVDLGSMNGTLLNGARVERAPIGEGDVMRICNHELRFSYRRPA